MNSTSHSFGNQRNDEQDALRRHEALHVAHEREGVVEGAEAVAVAGKDAENLALVARVVIGRTLVLASPSFSGRATSSVAVDIQQRITQHRVPRERFAGILA